jgi:hypothetical protein
MTASENQIVAYQPNETIRLEVYAIEIAGTRKEAQGE